MERAGGRGEPAAHADAPFGALLWARWLRQTFVRRPFRAAQLRVAPDRGTVSYPGPRRAGRVSHRPHVRPGEPVHPTERDVWLTSRRRAYTRRPGRIRETPVEHEPWPSAGTDAVVPAQTPNATVGMPVPHGESVMCFSPGAEHVRLRPSRPRCR
ncbi:DUF2071 domain-containing protein [Streptomyces canus]